MRTLFAAALIAVGVVGCSSNSTQEPYTPPVVCYTDDVFHQSAGQATQDEAGAVKASVTNEVVESSTRRCTNKPATEHFVKDTGMAKNCRPYYTTYRVKNQVRHVKAFMCQFADGSWQAVDGRYSYFN